MKDTKTKLMSFAASAALVTTLGLTACGGSSSSASSSSSSSSSTTSESTATESTTSSTETTTTTSSSASSSDKVDVSSWTDAWMGVSDKGETFYYAESTDGSQGAMLVYDPSSNQYVSFVGNTSAPQEGYVRIDDIQSGNALQFEVIAGDDEGSVVIDLGDQGKAVLAKCNISEVMKCFDSIDKYGNAIA